MVSETSASLLVALVAFCGDAQDRAPFARGAAQRHEHDPGHRAKAESDGECDPVSDHMCLHGSDEIAGPSEARKEAYADVRNDSAFAARREPRSSHSDLEGRIGGAVGNSHKERRLLLVEV